MCQNKRITTSLILAIVLSLLWIVPVHAYPVGGNPAPCGGKCCRDAACTEDVPSRSCRSNALTTASSVSLVEGTAIETYPVVSAPSANNTGLELSLFYSSYNADGEHASLNTVMGYGWSHSYNIFLFTQGRDLFKMSPGGITTKYQRARRGGALTATRGHQQTIVENSDGSIEISNNDTLTYRYERISNNPVSILGTVPWMLTRITDRNGNITELTYVNGLLDQVEDAYGRSITFTYDADKRLSTITDPLGRSTELAYDDSYNLASISDPLGKSVSYTYNIRHQIIGKTDKNDHLWSYEYDSAGHPTGTVDENGDPLLQMTNAAGWATDLADLFRNKQRSYVPSMTSQKDGRGNIWQYHYDKDGSITQAVAPDGATTTYTYDPVTLNVVTETDANGNTTSYEYDTRGNRTKITDCLGNVTEYTYESAFNNPIRMTDPNARITTWEYDAQGNWVKETDPLGNIRTWTYDANGNVLTETDKNGNVTSHEYDVFGNMTNTTDALGNVTTMTYDLIGNLLTRTDALGRVTTFIYDALDRLIQETDPLGKATQYVYDGEGNRIQVTDANGNSTTFEYDLRDRLVKTTDALGHVETQAYDGNNNRVSVTDKNGRTTTFEYDVQNRLSKVTDALGNSTTMTYDPVGNKISETDANGNTTTYEYDCLNRLIRKIDALGCVTTFEYDMVNGSGCATCSGPTFGSSLVTKQTDGNGKVTYFKYDALNRLVKKIRKEGDVADLIDSSDAVTEYTYDANGNRLSVTEPNGNTTTYVYDPLDRVIVETNAEGEAILTTYDAVGNVKTVTAPNGNVTANTYDALDRVIQVEDSVGLIATYSYDPVGNRISETDGNGNTTTYVYNAIYRLIRFIDPMGEPTHYTYDAVGNLLTVTDREGNVTTHEYDALNRRIKTTDALSCVTTYEYDPVGNPIRIIDANGNATRYEYDALNRQIKETYADGGERTFTYDCVGNLITRTDQEGRTTTYVYNDLYFLTLRDYPSDADDAFTYDLSGRMETADKGAWLVTFAYDGANRVVETAQNSQVLRYAYDIATGKRTIFYPSGRAVTEFTDLRGRLGSVNHGAGPAFPITPIAFYSYDLGNRVQTRQYENGVTADYTYNANNWISQLEHTAGATLVAGFGHDYDKEGNKKFEEKQYDPAHSEAYQYDDVHRLIDYKVGTLVSSSIPVPITQTAYDLDCLGNWDSKTTDGTTQNRTHNMVNELTAIDGVSLDYDDNGNLIEDERYTYVYDNENRLISVIRKGAVPEDDLVVGQYQYDALGRRVIKKFSPDGPIIETRYFYDDARVIEEQDHTTVTQAEYIYGNYIDEILVMRRAGQLYYYHQNALWSVAAITDSAANVVERYAYDAYGCATITDGANNPVPPNAWGTPHSAIDNPYMFTGRRLDEETGLYYYRARYYDCEKGRFLQRDPLGYVDGLNLYEYSASKPFKFTDPMGEAISQKQCNQAVNAAKKRNKKAKQLIEALKKKKCPVPQISCVCCTTTAGGFFNPNTKNITVCYNYLHNAGQVITTVVHELVHAWDDCTGTNWTNCDQHACSEIRAVNISGQCTKKGGWRKPNESYKKCVKRVATAATAANPNCTGNKASESVKKMFNKCFSDKRPIAK